MHGRDWREVEAVCTTLEDLNLRWIDVVSMDFGTQALGSIPHGDAAALGRNCPIASFQAVPPETKSNE